MTDLDLSFPTTQVTDPKDAAAHLKELNLTVEMLRLSIEAGDTARGKVSQEYYPLTYRGVVMWAETLAELRRQLLRLSDGYEIGRTSGYETVYCKKRDFAIAVVAGDSMVGKQGSRPPRLTRRKGIKTTERVRRNAAFVFSQGELFTVPEVTRRQVPDDETCLTWFLLVRPTESEVRLELSWPLFLTDGLVGGWQRRILVPPVPISGAAEPVNADEYIDDGNDDDLVTR